MVLRSGEADAEEKKKGQNFVRLDIWMEDFLNTHHRWHSDGRGREVSTLHSLGPPLRKRLVNLLLDGLHLRFLLLGDSKL